MGKKKKDAPNDWEDPYMSYSAILHAYHYKNDKKFVELSAFWQKINLKSVIKISANLLNCIMFLRCLYHY